MSVQSYSISLSVVLVTFIYVTRCERESFLQEESWKRDGFAAHVGWENADNFVNEWIVRIEGGHVVATRLAEEMGYENLGPMTGFEDTYRLKKNDNTEFLSKRDSPNLTSKLIKDPRVKWAEQQFGKQRVKRGTDILVMPLLKRDRAGDFRQMPVQQSRRFNDELWDHEWYLQDTRTRNDLPKLDLHVLPVYNLGITGHGVKVTVLDDGLEYTHDDLFANYDPSISGDVNDDDDDPSPRYDELNTNSHGTRCAGEIAMIANNFKCGVGVAFNCKIGGIRMLDGPVSDRVEGMALSYHMDSVDIYTSSWGPNDDGKTVEGPGTLAEEALKAGVTMGRNGKGVIYTWAAGNGGSHRDNCNCDGYTSSIYTLSVGSASEQGQFPWYGEMCASTMTVAYSSGAYTDQKIATTDLHNKCTISHTGTSAAAPLAAGIMALILEVNPLLSWRDVQHIVAWTSEESPLRDNPGWVENGAGYRVNLRFGFGLMNALGMVTAAANWTNVEPQNICTTDTVSGSSFGYGHPSKIIISTDGCRTSRNAVNFLEHVELVVYLSYPLRGALQVFLTSPQGTRTALLTERPSDTSSEGFHGWKFMSVHTWGERPQGEWIVEVLDETGNPDNVGEVISMNMILYGTLHRPPHLASGRRVYDDDYNQIHKKQSNPTEQNQLNELQKKEIEIIALEKQILLAESLLKARWKNLQQESKAEIEKFLTNEKFT